MSKRAPKGLRYCSALLVLSGYFALASVRHYGVGMLFFPLAFLILQPYGEDLEKRWPLYTLFSRFLMVACVFLIPLAIATLGLLNAVLALVIFIQGYSMLHQKQPRNYYHIYLMAFFLLLGAAVQSPEPIISLILILFMVSAVWSFMLLYLHTERQHSHLQSAPELIPMQRDSHAFLSSNQTLRPWGIGLFFFLLTLSTIAGALLLFVFTPRIEAGFLSRNRAPVMVTGLDRQVDLLSVGAIQEDPSAVMYVEFPDRGATNSLDIDALYWRLTTHNHYEKAQWTRRGLRYNYEPGVPALFSVERYEYREQYQRELQRGGRQSLPKIHQRIYMEEIPEEGMPCLDFVAAIQLVENDKNTSINWDGANDFTVRFSAAGPRRMTYEVWSQLRNPDPIQLREASTVYSDTMHERDYALLTTESLLEETRGVIARVTQGQASPYEKALALEEWLSGPDFVYSLTIPPMPKDHTIDAFLLESRQGHCELFATAFVLGMRSLGVPARVVSGYRGGEWDELEQACTVRASMAHLWAELYFQDEGWVRFDPSPSGGESEAEGVERLWLGIARTLFFAKMFWYQEIVGFDRARQIEGLQDMGMQAFSFLADSLRYLSVGDLVGGGGKGLQALGLLLLLFALLFVLLYPRLRKRGRPRRALNADQRRALRLFRLLKRNLSARAIPCKNTSAEEIHHQIKATKDLNRLEVLEVLAVYNAVRFGTWSLTKGEYKRLKRNLHKALRQQGRS